MIGLIRRCCWQDEPEKCSIEPIVESPKCTFCYSTTNPISRCDCQWQILCDECAIVQKQICNPCIRCYQLMRPVLEEDENMVSGMKILAEMAKKLCFFDDKQHGNNLVALQKADFDQIRALLICADPDDIYDIFCAVRQKGTQINMDYVMDLLHTMEENNGFKEGCIGHFRNIIPHKKRPRSEQLISLNCWVFKNKVQCVVSMLPPNNIVRVNLSTHGNRISCDLTLDRRI